MTARKIKVVPVDPVAGDWAGRYCALLEREHDLTQQALTLGAMSLNAADGMLARKMQVDAKYHAALARGFSILGEIIAGG